jgi:hypothetical protein
VCKQSTAGNNLCGPEKVLCGSDSTTFFVCRGFHSWSSNGTWRAAVWTEDLGGLRVRRSEAPVRMDTFSTPGLWTAGNGVPRSGLDWGNDISCAGAARKRCGRGSCRCWIERAYFSLAQTQLMDKFNSAWPHSACANHKSCQLTMCTNGRPSHAPRRMQLVQERIRKPSFPEVSTAGGFGRNGAVSQAFMLPNLLATRPSAIR